MKLADFGFSKRAINRHAEAHTGGGTLLYMAPEMQGTFQDEVYTRHGKIAYTEAVDIWAVGVMTFQILARRPPFRPDEIEKYVTGKLRFPTRRLRRAMASDEACHFLQYLITPRPTLRPNARECLKHYWLQSHTTPPEELLGSLHSDSGRETPAEKLQEASGTWASEPVSQTIVKGRSPKSNELVSDTAMLDGTTPEAAPTVYTGTPATITDYAAEDASETAALKRSESTPDCPKSLGASPVTGAVRYDQVRRGLHDLVGKLLTKSSHSPFTRGLRNVNSDPRSTTRVGNSVSSSTKVTGASRRRQWIEHSSERTPSRNGGLDIPQNDNIGFRGTHPRRSHVADSRRNSNKRKEHSREAQLSPTIEDYNSDHQQSDPSVRRSSNQQQGPSRQVSPRPTAEDYDSDSDPDSQYPDPSARPMLTDNQSADPDAAESLRRGRSRERPPYSHQVPFANDDNQVPAGDGVSRTNNDTNDRPVSLEVPCSPQGGRLRLCKENLDVLEDDTQRS